MANRLAGALSPYLRQHADNPVDWWEWGDEAFDAARERDVPVLLSVGYAACHWCHVMAHESFEDETTAAEMNAGFVNVKVDREERPDVDAVHMDAVQGLTGQGGWPMTVFLTPDGRPFYAGTYFPPQPLHGRPSFRQVLAAVGEAWTQRREEVIGAGERISQSLSTRTLPPGGDPPSADDLARAVRALAGQEDRAHGGFGGAPKFPPSPVLLWLLRHAATDGETAPVARGLAERTLAAMAASGTYDQLAGGFARYAVDAAWVVPHFEKMLYDNAQLARAYLHLWRLTGDATAARVALETCDWMLTDLLTPEGGLASALDADTDGVEGLTYVWTPEQLDDVLGQDQGRWAADLTGVTASGTFEHGTSTVRLLRDPWTAGEGERWEAARAALLAARRARPQPARDDKVVLAWNGLAVAALAETGALLGRPDLVEAARRCADLLVAVHLDADGRWHRVSRDGVAGAAPAVLEDLGDLAEGLLVLAGVTGEQAWTTLALGVLDQVLTEFVDDDGLLRDTSRVDADPRLEAASRGADPTDNAYPSGTSAAAGAFLRAAALTGDVRWRLAAERALATSAAVGRAAPRFAGWGLAVAEAALAGPLEVAVVGPGDDRRTAALHAVALAATSPGAVVARGVPDGDGVPLLAGRGLVGGEPAAYVCRGGVCDLPTTDAVRLAEQLRSRQGAAIAPVVE
jgi:uncharacterized protein YyaL (SSP411 family)